MVAVVYDPSTQKAEVGGCCSKPLYGPHRETVSKNKKQIQKNKITRKELSGLNFHI
jgi:hypothetical protein